MESFKSPPLCACCGSSKVASTWIVSNRKLGFSYWTLLTTPFGVSTYRRTTYTFEMPVCRVCREKLERIDKITTGINRSAVIGCGGIIGIGLMVLIAMGQPKYSWIVYAPVVAILALVGSSFGGAVGKLIEWVIKYLTVYDFCKFDGRYFHFDNQKFENAFASLNPGWVKRKSKWI